MPDTNETFEELTQRVVGAVAPVAMFLNAKSEIEEALCDQDVTQIAFYAIDKHGNFRQITFGDGLFLSAASVAAAKQASAYFQPCNEGASLRPNDDRPIVARGDRVT